VDKRARSGKIKGRGTIFCLYHFVSLLLGRKLCLARRRRLHPKWGTYTTTIANMFFVDSAVRFFGKNKPGLSFHSVRKVLTLMTKT
jgi:hypothetical protein